MFPRHDFPPMDGVRMQAAAPRGAEAGHLTLSYGDGYTGYDVMGMGYTGGYTGLCSTSGDQLIMSPAVSTSPPPRVAT